MHLINRYFPDLTKPQIAQFEQLFELYTFWNERINLVSRKDIDQLYLRHILHSLAIAKFIQFKPGTKIMDVGTGGGFPGIPLAIMFPETDFLLIDSIQKKIKVVADVIDKTGLKNCKSMVCRAESVTHKFDFVVTRAVAPLPKLHAWVKKSILKDSKHTLANGIICLKGGDLTEEMTPFAKYCTSKNIRDYFDDDFFDTKKVIHLFK